MISNSLFKVLEKDQKNRFVSYVKSKNKMKDTRNLALIDAFYAGKEKEIEVEIGGNAYRGLKKRLLDNLINFLAEDIIKKEVSEEIRIIKQLVVSRKLMELGYFKRGFKMLQALSIRAQKIEHYSLVNEIYHTQIQFSYHELAPNQEVLYQNLIQNSKTQLNQERLNMAFAVIKRDMKESLDVKELINSVYKRFEVDMNEGFNFKSLFQLAELANSEGAYSNDYYSVNLFFEDKVEEIMGSEMDLPKHFTYKADLLLSLANIYLRKRDFVKSQLYINKASEVLIHCPSQFKQTRKFQVNTLKSLCLTYSGHLDEAIELLEITQKNSLLSAYIDITLVSAYFLKGELNKGKSLIKNYYQSDSYYEKHLGREWILNKIYIEVIISIENGDIDFAEARMNSLIRRYSSYLKSLPNSHVLSFIKLVRHYCRYPEEVTSEKFELKVEKTIDWKPSEQEDLFLMTIYAWLKAKMVKKEIYDILLDLVVVSI